MSLTTEQLLDRALSMICSEWGWSRAEAMAYLRDDANGPWTFEHEVSDEQVRDHWVQFTREHLAARENGDA